MPNASLHLDALVNEVACPFRVPPVVQAHLAVRVPAGVEDPLAQVLRDAGHGIGVVPRSVFLEVPDLTLERLAQGLVGVKRENPIVVRLLGGPVLLPGVTAP